LRCMDLVESERPRSHSPILTQRSRGWTPCSGLLQAHQETWFSFCFGSEIPVRRIALFPKTASRHEGQD
jgi:hypothetical protein